MGQTMLRDALRDRYWGAWECWAVRRPGWLRRRDPRKQGIELRVAEDALMGAVSPPVLVEQLMRDGVAKMEVAKIELCRAELWQALPWRRTKLYLEAPVRVKHDRDIRECVERYVFVRNIDTVRSLIGRLPAPSIGKTVGWEAFTIRAGWLDRNYWRALLADAKRRLVRGGSSDASSAG